MTPERVQQLWEQTFKCPPENGRIVRFARLLANEVKEECAQACDRIAPLRHENGAEHCAEAIRAMKEV